MNTVTLRANAKINLTLDILRRRPDGYHDLSMVMQSVSLYDRLTAQRQDQGITLACDAPGMPTDGNTLMHRAAAAFFAETGLTGGVHFTLDCRIPMQAGLGGGSADAAATLIALNRLYDARLSESDLCRLGKSLGADVPFCLVGGTRLAEGIGECLRPLPAPPACTIVLIKPEAGASTAEQFARADVLSDLPHPSAARMAEALASGSLFRVADALGNSFEAVIDLPEVALCRRTLLELGAVGACMTGSGSTVFGLFEQENTARLAAEAARSTLKNCRVFVCHPVTTGIVPEN